MKLAQLEWSLKVFILLETLLLVFIVLFITKGFPEDLSTVNRIVLAKLWSDSIKLLSLKLWPSLCIRKNV